MDLEKYILLNTPYLNYCIVDKKELDNSDFIGAILMNLSKIHDCLPHDLIIAKFEAYGLSKNRLKLVLDYLDGRKQRVEISSSYSFWPDVKRSVPQGYLSQDLYFLMFLSMICLCLLRAVKSVISPMTAPFIVVKWDYLAL